MDREAWQAAVHRVTESWTRLSDSLTRFYSSLAPEPSIHVEDKVGPVWRSSG